MNARLIRILKPIKNFKVWEYFNATLTKKINGQKVRIPIKAKVGLINMTIKHNWLDALIRQFFSINDKSIFIDVGVNLGQTLIRLKTIYPNIEYLGFEPNSACTSYTQKLISINEFKNCTIQNVALSDKQGVLQLEKNSTVDSCASVIKNLRPGFFTSQESVMAIDYDSFYLDNSIGFVKVDVEGAEYEVLKGMSKAIKKYQPIITCEVLDSFNSDLIEFTQNRANQLCELITELGYGIIQLKTDNMNIVDYESIENITIVRWTQESNSHNDYIFYPLSKEELVTTFLDTIITTA